MNKTGTQTLETHRLILRPFKIEDADEMFNNWASDPEVTRFLTWPTHSSVDVTRMVLNDWISHYEDGAYFNWAIELRETGSVIGNIAVVQLREDIEQVEIGYCMSRAFWGQGIMPEAFRAVMEYLFTVVGIRIFGLECLHIPDLILFVGSAENIGLQRGFGRAGQLAFLVFILIRFFIVPAGIINRSEFNCLQHCRLTEAVDDNIDADNASVHTVLRCQHAVHLGIGFFERSIGIVRIIRHGY